jgi:hypothetical protein
VPLEKFAPLAQVKGVELVSLQKGAGVEQIAKLKGRFPVRVAEGEGEEMGFVDTAALVNCLDLVVCVDTSVAHLAGAIGLPVWVALAAVADWRWLREREDTPWYPAMRLFRQQRLGEWDDVFARMADELRLRQGERASRTMEPGVGWGSGTPEQDP